MIRQLMAVGLLGLTTLVINAAEVQAPKNFIIILADDFGYGDLGCYRELFRGGDDNSMSSEFTPHLDRLGREGVRFMQAYTTSWCAPARQNILSGRWCNRADNVKRPWIGKQLRDAGYSTCFVGKSHGNNSSDKVLNDNPETAEYNDGLFFVGGARNFYLRKGEEFPCRVDFKSQPFVARGGEYLTDVFTDFSADFISRSAKSGNPFFLYLAYTASHSPLDGKLQDLQKMFPGEFDDIEEEDWREFLNATNGKTFKPMARNRLRGVRALAPGWSLADSPANKRLKKIGEEKFIKYNFAALVYGMDRGIGKIMKILKEAGVEDDTLVVFTCDNGSITGSNYPLTGFKATSFEGGVRVPMIFWSKMLAESAGGGRLVEEISPTTDIAPTLVALAEKKDKSDFPFDGINLWPYLSKNSQVPDDQVFFYANGSSQYSKACGLHRENTFGRPLLKKDIQAMADRFGSTDIKTSIFNAVYVKGKEKLVYWSTLDGTTRGAEYKLLPTDARKSENPPAFFKETLVTGGEFPKSNAGKKLLAEFADYTKPSGAGELMYTPIFVDNHKKKRAHDYIIGK